MKNTSFISALIFVFAFFAITAKAQTNPNNITIGVIDSVDSKILNEKKSLKCSKIFCNVQKYSSMLLNLR